MKVATAYLESIEGSPYQQSKAYTVEKKSKEGHDAYEKRTWRERCHATKDGRIFIPALAFKKCLAECAQYLSIQIPGKGKATYTKNFEAGVVVPEDLVVSETKDTVEGRWVFGASDGGRSKKSSRVWKCFPTVAKWSGAVRFFILDDIITEEVFMDVLRQSGIFIGVGTWRPRNGGEHGRFRIKKLEWSEQD